MKYTLIRSLRKTISVEVKPSGEIIVRAPKLARKRDIDAFLESKRDWIARTLEKVSERQKKYDEAEKLSEDELEALRRKAKEYIPQRTALYAKQMGVTYGRITIRTQKTRWGSCSAKGNLNFNCLLMLTSVDVIDSVVVHELCHLIEMNHSKRFYDSLYTYFPDYDRCHNWLREHGAELMGRVK